MRLQQLPLGSVLPPGLAELAARKYKQAAKCFLLASFDHCDFPEVRGRESLGPCKAGGRLVGGTVLRGTPDGVLVTLLVGGGWGGGSPSLCLGFLFHFCLDRQ